MSTLIEKIEKHVKATANMMDCEMAFAVPGEDSLIDCINPDTGRSWINDETLEQIRLRYPLAEVMKIDDFCAAKAAKQDSPVEWSETTAENYNDMLEVLPPALWERGGFLVGEPWDHHATNGQPRFAAFVQRGGKYYEASRPMTRAEFKATDFSQLTVCVLIASAAEAIETIGEDELERSAKTFTNSALMPG